MYIRHDESGNVIYVPEDVPDRDFVPTCNVRSVDPPIRRNFIGSMAGPDRETALVRGYIESRVGCKDKDESASCRAFLKAWHAIEADGNTMSIGLAIMRGGSNCVQFYFKIHGIGPVVWLPVLVTASTDRTAHIMRETSANRLALVRPTPKPAPLGDEPPRRFIPPKVDTVLIRPKRPR